MTAQTLEDVVIDPPVDTVPCPICVRVIPLFEAVDVRDLPDDINANSFVCGACLHEEVRKGNLDPDSLKVSLTVSPHPASASVVITTPSTNYGLST